MSVTALRALTGAEVAHLRHELRTPINQVVGYCEMMLEDAAGPLAHRAPMLSQALVAVREATGLIDSGLPPTASSIEVQDLVRLYESLRVPQTRIIDAMSALLREGTGVGDAAFVADVCRVRDAAERLLPSDRRRAETTGVFTAPAAVAVPPVVHTTTAGGRSARILVVDDVEENRGVLQRRLQREGHAVACARSGLEALAEVGKAPFDMILLDVMMPDMDGYETLERLKANDATRDIPVIMISALDDIASIVRCIERGAADYLPKPFDPVLLRARISACLEQKILRERERAFLRDAMELAAAAVAVERGTYPAGLTVVAARADELGTLARVFASMIAGVRGREERLRAQVERLREEIADIADVPTEPLGNSRHALIAGDVLGDRYVIERLIGAGGMGVVYLAYDRELGERVAIKALRPEMTVEDSTAQERFRNEIKLARRMAHRNIVRTHDLGRSESVQFVTMEYVEGTTLRAVLDRRGRLGVPATLAMARQLAEALESAHASGIIHRDIKPQNLLLDASGTLKVMDFGIARLVHHANSLTQVGAIVGTPTYMSPEQLLDEAVDVRSDLYAVGVVLYECLTGVAPYEGKSPVSLIANILRGGAIPPVVRQPDLPPAISSLVMQLLSSNRDARVESAGALSQSLAGFA